MAEWTVGVRRVGRVETQRAFGRGEVDDIAVRLEHVHLLDGLDGLDIELLQRGLQLLLVGAAGLVDLLDLSSHCALAAANDQLSAPAPAPRGIQLRHVAIEQTYPAH
jgi:hypothetical protein